MRVLVTGAAGFIGMSVASHLMERGDHVLGIDSLNDYCDVTLKQARLERLRAIGGGQFAFHQVDFADQQALNQSLSDEAFDRVVHLGAQPGVRYLIENPAAYVQSNVVRHLNL